MSDTLVMVTEKAAAKILEMMGQQGETDSALRFGVMGRGPGGFQYKLGFVSRSDRTDDDTVIEAGDGLRLYVDAKSADQVRGTTIEFVEDPMGAGFRIDNPNPLWADAVSMKVQKLLDDVINPQVASHGGWVALLEVKGETAYIQLGGGCQGCGMADVTLKQGIEVSIKEQIPEIREVIDTTDHAGGTNPYYKGGHAGHSAVR
jgi:Fe/S biogenesis protein NfuA